MLGLKLIHVSETDPCRYECHSCIVILYRYEYRNCFVIIWQSTKWLIHLNKMYCSFVGTSCIHWYLQRVVSFLRFVFIVKWNIKHYITQSVYHSIFQYQAFSSIYRYLKSCTLFVNNFLSLPIKLEQSLCGIFMKLKYKIRETNNTK